MAGSCCCVAMTEPLPILLIPGLAASPRLFAAQIPELWRFGPVTIADHTRDDSFAGMARRILAAAPPRFALAGLSMGGYAAFEIMRQAPQRVAKLALLDTTARPDAPEQSEARREQIERARAGRYSEIPDQLFPRLVHRDRVVDESLRQIVRDMADEVGADGFIRQQTANMNRPDSRPSASSIRCPTLVLVGDDDQLTPPDRASEIAGLIPGARLVTVPASGHLSTLERPREVTQALVEWLRA
jgi:pimeloyl-ACP methyl ester carboxylesterase